MCFSISSAAHSFMISKASWHISQLSPPHANFWPYSLASGCVCFVGWVHAFTNAACADVSKFTKHPTNTFSSLKTLSLAFFLAHFQKNPHEGFTSSCVLSPGLFLDFAPRCDQILSISTCIHSFASRFLCYFWTPTLKARLSFCASCFTFLNNTFTRHAQICLLPDAFMTLLGTITSAYLGHSSQNSASSLVSSSMCSSGCLTSCLRS